MFWIIHGLPDEPFVLGLQSRTLKKANQSISWQKVGGAEDAEMAICYRVAPTLFKNIKDGTLYEVDQSIFTSEAWCKFIDNFKE
jgi:hypothetical protein